MTKKYFKLAFLFVWGMSYVITCDACGGEINQRGFTLFLNPYSKEQPKHQYLYNPFTFNYVYDYEYVPTSEVDINVAEWNKVFNAKNTDDVRKLIYDNNLADLNVMSKGKLANIRFKRLKLQAKNPLYKQLYQNNDLLEYVRLIQDYSNRVLSYDEDEWDYSYHVQRADPSNLATNISQADELYTLLITKNDLISQFIKPRLAYHMVRAFYFNNLYDEASNAYHIYAKSQEKEINNSIVQEWLLGLKAGIALHNDQPENAILHFAKKFNEGKHTHHQAYIDLKLLSKDYNMLLPLNVAASKNDSLAIYAAASATNSELSSNLFLDKIAAIDDDEIRYFLWFRELQKVEETYFHPKICKQEFDRYDYYGEYLRENKSVIIANVAAFKTLTQILYTTAKTEKYKDYMANGLDYVAMLEKGGFTASLNATDNLSKAQKLIYSLYTQTEKSAKLNQDDVVQLMNVWKGSNNLTPENKETVNYFIRDFIAPHYLYEQKDTASALLLWAMGDSYFWREKKANTLILTQSNVADNMINYDMSTAQYEAMATLLTTQKNFILKWLKQNKIRIHIEPEKEPNLLLYKYVRDENWDAANSLVAKSNLRYKKQSFYDPSIMHYDGYLSPTSIDSSKPFLSAKEFLNLGTTLKSKARDNPTAQDLANYGMYLFSTTFHGHNSIADNGNLGYVGSSYNRPFFYLEDNFETEVYYNYFQKRFALHPSKNVMDYYQCYKSESYFKEAYTVLTDKEDKAKCCFMLAKCRQKQCPKPKQVLNEYDYYWDAPIKYKGQEYEAYEYHSKTNPYLREMATKYADTRTYLVARTNCSYLEYILF